MYANAYELRMPTNYVDMNESELEYSAGLFGGLLNKLMPWLNGAISIGQTIFNPVQLYGKWYYKFVYNDPSIA